MSKLKKLNNKLITILKWVGYSVPVVEKILWVGDENCAHELKKFLESSGYNYQIMAGNKRWNPAKNKEEYFTEQFLLYIDELGGYIDTGTVLFKNSDIINDEEIIFITRSTKYKKYKGFLEKKI